MIKKFTTISAQQTEELGERLGKNLPQTIAIELVSDLGGGKTTLTKGLARGLGYGDEVTSPTFTISRVYKLPDSRELHHFDLYRLDGTDVATDDLLDSVDQKNIITVIEWPGSLGDKLPKDRLIIKFDVTGDDVRSIIVESKGEVSDKILAELVQ